MKEWDRKNPEKVRLIKKRWKENKPDCDRIYYLKNKDKIKKRTAAWRKNNAERCRILDRNWKIRNRVKLRAMASQRIKSYSKDLNFVVKKNLRIRMHRALRGIIKVGRTKELLGCSIEDFRRYIETKFITGMTWENYGCVWEIDHIMPCAIYDLSRPEHQRSCFHFSNLQPLFKSDNRRKHAKVLSNQYALL